MTHDLMVTPGRSRWRRGRYRRVGKKPLGQVGGQVLTRGFARIAQEGHLEGHLESPSGHWPDGDHFLYWAIFSGYPECN